MNTKLTLNVDKQIIERAKAYASSGKISLSRLVENYLSAISGDASDRLDISPLTKELSTIVKMKKKKIDCKKAKEEYLLKQFLEVPLYFDS